jgi:hypothetical protein
VKKSLGLNQFVLPLKDLIKSTLEKKDFLNQLESLITLSDFQSGTLSQIVLRLAKDKSIIPGWVAPG